MRKIIAALLIQALPAAADEGFFRPKATATTCAFDATRNMVVCRAENVPPFLPPGPITRVCTAVEVLVCSGNDCSCEPMAHCAATIRWDSNGATDAMISSTQHWACDVTRNQALRATELK